MDDILICDNCLVPLDMAKIDSHVCKLIDPKINLSQCQIDALMTTNKKCKVFSTQAKHSFYEKISKFDYDMEDLKKCKNYFKNIVQVTINFKINHLHFYINDDYYKNGLEVNNLFSGSNSTRIAKEDIMFFNKYKNANPKDRVKYGALNILNNKKGSCASAYGDCFFILKNSVKPRITFEYGNSSNTSLHMGNFNHFYSVLCHLPEKLLKELMKSINNEVVNYNAYKKYIEAQIHGLIRFKYDIEEVVIPQKYMKTNSKLINTFCMKYNIKLRYY
jgi:hypothetical protein